jgi:hypothetical protein
LAENLEQAKKIKRKKWQGAMVLDRTNGVFLLNNH